MDGGCDGGHRGCLFCVALDAGQRAEFHAMDDQFHRDICAYAGLDFVWSLVKENKGHMDRARYLSLTHGARTALDEHRLIMATLRDRDPARAAAAVSSATRSASVTLSRSL